MYAEFGLGEGELDILATLRCTGAPYELSPRDLGHRTMGSSGAVTKRVDRCLEQGWGTRRVSDDDGRGRVIALTDAGVDLIDRAFVAHMANEKRLVEMLAETERTEFAVTLESWGESPRRLDGMS